MNIFRIVISFMREQMQFMHERAAFAMTPGQALDDTMLALRIDRSKIYSLKILVLSPESLEDFNPDTLYMQAIGSDMLLRDLWKRKHGD